MHYRVIALSMAALAAGYVTPAFGQAAAPARVGVIDIQGALIGTKEGQKAVSELQARQGPRQKDLAKKQGDIKSLQDSLSKGTGLSEQTKQELARTIDVKTKQFNRDLDDARAEAEQDEKKILNSLGQRMMAVIDKYARDNGYTVVLDVSNPQTPVLFAANSVNITKEVVDLYDKSAGSGSGAPAPSAAKPPAAPVRPTSVAPAKKQP